MANYHTYGYQDGRFDAEPMPLPGRRSARVVRDDSRDRWLEDKCGGQRTKD